MEASERLGGWPEKENGPTATAFQGHACTSTSLREAIACDIIRPVLARPFAIPAWCTGTRLSDVQERKPVVLAEGMPGTPGMTDGDWGPPPPATTRDRNQADPPLVGLALGAPEASRGIAMERVRDTS